MKLTCPACGARPVAQEPWKRKRGKGWSAMHGCPTHGCPLGSAPMGHATSKVEAVRNARENWKAKAAAWDKRRKAKKPGT